MPIPPDDVSIAHSGDMTSSTVGGGPSPASRHVPNGDGGFDPIGSGGNSAETESVVSDTLIADGDDAEWDKVGQDIDLDLDGLLAESEALDPRDARARSCCQGRSRTPETSSREPARRTRPWNAYSVFGEQHRSDSD